jgi:RNA polymerase sigma factor for flagellar operon FliA
VVHKLSKEETRKLIKEFKQTGDRETHRILIEHYMSLVSYLSERYASKLPPAIEVDDLKSAGVLGLMDAIDRFDEGKGVQFETYCTIRINGSIRDEIRAQDWVPRSIRSKITKLDRALRALVNQLNRDPLDHEVAAYLNISLDDFQQLKKDASVIGMVSLNNNTPSDDPEQASYLDILEDQKAEDPYYSLAKKELMGYIDENFSKKERLVIALYYHEKFTLRDIAEILYLCESRVSQIHTSILSRLRSRLSDPYEKGV